MALGVQKQGVQRQTDTGLGFRQPSQTDAAALEVGRAVLQTMAEQGEALGEARDALDEARLVVDGVRENALAHQRNAEDLWQALRTVVLYVREVEETKTDKDGKIPLPPMPDEVEVAMTTLARLQAYEQATAPPMEYDVACPECVAGKHPNCTGTVLRPDDTTGECACAVAGHIG